MIRLGMTLGIKEEKIEEYKKLHANVWPEVLENLTELNFKNYSIYLHKNTLFGYVEYHGDNLDRDNKLMASNPKVQEWEELMWNYQQALPQSEKGSKWVLMDKIFDLNK